MLEPRTYQLEALEAVNEKKNLLEGLFFLNSEIKKELSEDRKASLQRAKRRLSLHLKAAEGDSDATIELSFLAGINTKEERDDYFRIKAQCEANDGSSAWGV